MLKIYDKDHNAIGHIVKYKDCKIESEVSTGDKTLSFVYLSKHHMLENEMYIRTKDDEYVIKEVPAKTGDFPQIVAVLNLEDLQRDMWQTFSVTDTTIDAAVRPVLAGTGWTVGHCDVIKKRNAGMMQVSTLDVIQNLCTAFMCEPVFDTINKTVSFYQQRGEDKGVYFLGGLNLKKLQKKSTSYDFYTRIIPIGQNGLTIESVNNGRNYLENYQYSSKVLTYIWKDESYTDAQALMEDSELKLNDLSKPEKSFQADVRDLAKQKSEYSILSYGLGDTVTIIDQESGTRESQRIKKIVEYPQNPEKNTCEIANTVLTFEELQKKYQSAANIINYTVTGDGRYTGTINVSDILNFESGLAGSSTISGINNSITDIQGEVAVLKLTLGELDVNYLSAEEADLKYATITELNATNVTLQSVQGDYALFKSTITDELAAHTALIDELKAREVTVDYLDANYAQINLANIEQGCITTAMLGTGIVETAQIADGSITDAKIVELTANKITAGILSVERLEIRGSENSIVYALNNISGALQAQNVDTINGEILTERTITADKIVANAITSNEIAAKTILANNIAAGTITGDEIAAKAVTAAKIDAGAITTEKIAANAVTAAKIDAGAITTEKIAANAVTAAKIDVTNLFAQDITATGTITGATLIGATGTFDNVIADGILVKNGTIEDVLYMKNTISGDTFPVITTVDLVGYNNTVEIGSNTMIDNLNIRAGEVRVDGSYFGVICYDIDLTADGGNINLVGDTDLFGCLITTGNITANSTASSWVQGMTTSRAAFGINTTPDGASYFPAMAGKTNGGHVWNIGTYVNQFGIYGFKSGRTANGYDWTTYWDVSTGDIVTSKSFKANDSICSAGLTTYGGQFNAVYNNYGVMLRNDGSNFYILLSNSGTPYTWNSFRPLIIGLTSGVLECQTKMLLKTAGNEARVQVTNNYGDMGLCISTAGNKGIYDWGKSRWIIKCPSDGRMVIGDKLLVAFDEVATDVALRPTTAKTMSCGTSSYPFSKFYATSTTIGTSDEREKQILTNDLTVYSDLFMSLEPIAFKWIDPVTDRKIHFGLGAQTTVRKFAKFGLNALDYELVQYDILEEPTETGQTDRYGMSYQDLQMLTMMQTQKNTREIERLTFWKNDIDYQLQQAREEIAELKNEIALLKALA